MSEKTVDESPDINKKKNEQNGKVEGDQFTWENMGKFVLSVIYLLIYVLIYFGLSGCILYSCKVAQANLIPTSANCAPYEKADPIFSSNETTCNIFQTIFEEPQLSEKIRFEYSDENKKNSFLDWLRKTNISNDSSFVYLGLSNIESQFEFTFSCLSIFLNWMNKLPEFLVVLFGPIVFLFWISIVCGLSSIYYIILSIFMPFKIFLKEKVKSFNSEDIKNYESLNQNLNNSGLIFEQLPEKYKWRDTSGYDWWLRLGLAFFSLLFTLVYFAISAPLAGLVMVWCLITIISYVGYMTKPGEEDKKVGVSNIASEIYGQYKKLIGVIISILVILKAFSNLGTIGLVISIIIVISSYFGWIPFIKVFEPFNYDDLTPLADDKQTEKTCAFSDTELQNKGLIPEYNSGSSILENLLSVPIVTTDTDDTNDDTNAVAVPAKDDDNTNVPVTNTDTNTDVNVPVTNTDTNVPVNTDVPVNTNVPVNTDAPVNTDVPVTDTNAPNNTDIPVTTNEVPINNPNTEEKGQLEIPLKGGRKIKNKSLSKYKNKYNVLNYK